MHMKGVRHAVPSQTHSPIHSVYDPTFAMAASGSSTLSLVGDRPSLAGTAAVVRINDYEASTQRGKKTAALAQMPSHPTTDVQSLSVALVSAGVRQTLCRASHLI